MADPEGLAGADYLSLWATTSAAVIFLLTGISKAASLRAFQVTLANYDIIGRSADRAVIRAAASIVASVELLLAFGFLGSPVFRTEIAAFSLLLVTGFSAAITANLVRGRRIRCGCSAGATGDTISPVHLVRNAVVAIACVLAIPLSLFEGMVVAPLDQTIVVVLSGIMTALLLVELPTIASVISWGPNNTESQTIHRAARALSYGVRQELM